MYRPRSIYNPVVDKACFPTCHFADLRGSHLYSTLLEDEDELVSSSGHSVMDSKYWVNLDRMVDALQRKELEAAIRHADQHHIEFSGWPDAMPMPGPSKTGFQGRKARYVASSCV